MLQIGAAAQKVHKELSVNWNIKVVSISIKFKKKNRGKMLNNQQIHKIGGEKENANKNLLYATLKI